jgi:hypothetical protein
MEEITIVVFDERTQAVVYAFKRGWVMLSDKASLAQE